MKMEVKRSRIEIIPENKIDEAYIEEVLGLKEEGDTCVCRREDAMGLSALAYIYIEKIEINK